MLKRYDSSTRRNSPYVQLRYLPQILHNLSFPFLLGMSQEKLKIAWAIFLFWERGGDKKYYGSPAHVEFMLQDKNPAPYLFQFSFYFYFLFTPCSTSHREEWVLKKSIGIFWTWRVGVWLFSGTTQYFFFVPVVLQKGHFLMNSNAKII